MLSERFEEALLYATRLHAEQERKCTGAPYVSHLLRVCGFVLEYGGDENVAIAALLHDAVEDQGGKETLQAIEERFGTDVAGIVDACSDAYGHPKPPWKERKDAYLTRLEEATASTMLISAADKLDNILCTIKDIRQCGADVWKRFHGGRDHSLWYYEAVHAVLARRLDNAIVDELGHALATMKELAFNTTD